MARQRGNFEVEIFNFSYLDILGCTIGGIMFVLFVSMMMDQSSSSVPRERTQGSPEVLAGLRRTLDEANTRLRELRRQPTPISPAQSAVNPPSFTPAQVSKARQEVTLLRRQLEQLTEALARRTTVKIPTALQGFGGSHLKPLHVECTKDGVIVYPSKELEPTEYLREGGIFDDAIEEVARDPSRSLVLWIRPDGVRAFDAAASLALRQDMNIGWEPLDADWTVDFTGLSKD